MKVRELIAELSKCDPEATVNTNGGAILAVDGLPGYYDGHYEQHIKNDDDDVIGVRFTRSGSKVVFIAESYDDLLMNCDTTEEMDKIVFEFDKSLDPSTIERIKTSILIARKNAIDINEQVARQLERRKEIK